MFRKQKGFTLMEVLIVVAVIVILASISVSVLTDLIEKSRETADIAAIDTAYTEIMAAIISVENGTFETTTGEAMFTTVIKYKDSNGDENYRMNVHIQQHDSGWALSAHNYLGTPIPAYDAKYKNASPYYLVNYNYSKSILTIDFKHS